MSEITVRPDGPEGQPDHVTPDLKPLTPCAFHEPDCGNVTLGWDPDPPQPAVEPEREAPQHFGEMEPAPVEPERRTVSLEVLTDELYMVAAGADMIGGWTAAVPVEAKVGIVLRVDGEAVAVAEVDTDWTRPTRQPVDVLAALLRQAQFYATEHEALRPGGAELLMPTPDVLAALDGRPDATFWTAPVPVTARHVEEGWLVVGYSGPGMEEPVEAKNPDCGEADCPWPGDCTQLTIGDDKPQHFADWTTLTVRIPAAVSRG